MRQHLYTPTFLLGFAYNFIISLHFTNNALYPLYVRHEGGGAALVGLFMGAYAIAGVAARPFVGLAIDRYGAKPMLVSGSLLLSLPAAGYVLILGHGLGPIAWVLRILQGAGYGAHFSATFSLAGFITPPHRRNEGLAMYGVSGLAGAVIGPFLGEGLVERAGLSAFFIVMVGVGICAAAVALRIPHHEARHPGTPARLPHAALNTPALRSVVVLAFLLATLYACPITFLAAFAKERGIVGFSLYFTAWGAGGIAMRVVGGTWGDRVGLRRVLVPGYLVYGAGLLTIAAGASLPAVIAAGVLCGAAHGISFPAVVSLGFAAAPPGAKGSAMALVTGTMDAAAAIVAFALGPAAQRTGLVVVFPAAASAALLATILLLRDIRNHRAPIRSPELPSG